MRQRASAFGCACGFAAAVYIAALPHPPSPPAAWGGGVTDNSSPTRAQRHRSPRDEGRCGFLHPAPPEGAARAAVPSTTPVPLSVRLEAGLPAPQTGCRARILSATFCCYSSCFFLSLFRRPRRFVVKQKTRD